MPELPESAEDAADPDQSLPAHQRVVLYVLIVAPLPFIILGLPAVSVSALLLYWAICVGFAASNLIALACPRLRRASVKVALVHNSASAWLVSFHWVDSDVEWAAFMVGVHAVQLLMVHQFLQAGYLSHGVLTFLGSVSGFCFKDERPSRPDPHGEDPGSASGLGRGLSSEAEGSTAEQDFAAKLIIMLVALVAGLCAVGCLTAPSLRGLRERARRSRAVHPASKGSPDTYGRSRRGADDVADRFTCIGVEVAPGPGGAGRDGAGALLPGVGPVGGSGAAGEADAAGPDVRGRSCRCDGDVAGRPAGAGVEMALGPGRASKDGDEEGRRKVQPLPGACRRQASARDAGRGSSAEGGRPPDPADGRWMWPLAGFDGSTSGGSGSTVAGERSSLDSAAADGRRAFAGFSGSIGGGGGGGTVVEERPSLDSAEGDGRQAFAGFSSRSGGSGGMTVAEERPALHQAGSGRFDASNRLTLTGGGGGRGTDTEERPSFEVASGDPAGSGAPAFASIHRSSPLVPEPSQGCGEDGFDSLPGPSDAATDYEHLARKPSWGCGGEDFDAASRIPPGTRGLEDLDGVWEVCPECQPYACPRLSRFRIFEESAWSLYGEPLGLEPLSDGSAVIEGVRVTRVGRGLRGQMESGRRLMWKRR